MIRLGSAVLLVTSCVLASSIQAEAVDATSNAAAERVAIGTCAICHGPQGHSFSPKFPVLSGQ